MPYTIPTANEFQLRYTEFAAVNDTLIDFVIADAARFVDETWLEDDYQRAIMAFAAHQLIMEGALGGNTSSSGVIQSEKLGDASTTYGVGGSSSGSDFGSTTYGKTFLRIQRVNVPAVAIT
jgi:hypothetical protein